MATDYRLFIDNSEDFDLYHNRNLDIKNIYKYYYSKGFNVIIARHILFNFAQILFVGFAINYMMNCIDYSALIYDDKNLHIFECKNGLFRELSLILTVPIFIRCVAVLIGFPKLIKSTIKMRKYVSKKLGIDDKEMNLLRPHEFITLMANHTKKQKKVEQLSELDIINIIMRKENYIIAIFNKDILDFEFDLCCGKKLNLYSKFIEWCIDYVIYSTFFDIKGNMRYDSREFATMNTISSGKLAERINKKIYIAATLSLLLSPLLIFYVILYYIFNNTERIKNNSGFLRTREWTRIAKYKFRDFNELPDLYEHRLAKTYEKSEKYIGTFYNYTTSLIAKFISFIFASIFAILFALTLINEKVLAVELFGDKTVLWTLSIIVMCIAITRGLIKDSCKFANQNKIMRKIITQIHIIPNNWIDNAQHEWVRDKFAAFFRYKIINWIIEIISIPIAPFILIFYVRGRINDIVEFFIKYSAESNVGTVCKLGLFNIKDCGNPNFSGHFSENFNDICSEGGKMEISMLNFKSNFPEWIGDISQSSFIHSRGNNIFISTLQDNLNLVSEIQNVEDNDISLEDIVNNSADIERSGSPKLSEITRNHFPNLDMEEIMSEINAEVDRYCEDF